MRWLLVATWLLGSTAPAQEVPAPAGDAARARWIQETVPGWEARAAVASRRVEAREGFFAGEVSFGEAFPDLVDARLDRPELVRGRLVQLQQRASAREVERQEPLPELEEVAAGRAARDLALDLEDRADALERRALTGLDALLIRAPALTDVALEPLREPLRRASTRIAEPDGDPAVQAAREARAAGADAELAALERLLHGLRLHAIAGRPLPDPTEDLALLQDPARGDPAAQRLRLLLPFLPASAGEPVREALSAFSGGPALERATRAREEAARLLADARAGHVGVPDAELPGRLAEAQTEVQRLDARIAALGPDAPEGPRLTLDRDAARDRLQAWQTALQRLRGDGQVDADAAAVAADRARAEAQAAAASAEDDVARARAAFLGQAADAQDRMRVLAEAREAREAELAAGAATRDEQLASLRARMDAAFASSLLSGDAPEPDDVYTDLRRFRARWMDGEVARGAAIDAAIGRMDDVAAHARAERARIAAALQVHPDDEAVGQAADDWRDALDAEQAAAARLHELAVAERAAVLASLDAAAEIRRSLRGSVTWQQLELDRSQLFADIGRELRLLGPTVDARVRQRGSDLWALPGRFVRDSTLIRDFFAGSFWTIVLLGGWFWARGRSMDVAGRIAVQVRRVREDLRPIDLQRLKGPLAEAVKGLTDLGLGWLMVGRIAPLSPELAFLVQCWLLVALYRFLVASFDLLVVRAPDFRPSLVTLAPAMYDTARLTARLAVGWSIGKGFAAFVLWGTLRLDVVSGLVGTAFDLAGLVLAVALLFRWEPLLRERIRARNQESALVATLSREVPRPFKPLAALALLGFFAATLLVDLTYFLVARDRTGLGRMFNYLTRFKLGAAVEADTVLPAHKVDALCAREPSRAVYVPRPGVEQALDEAFAFWVREHRRGMVALIGDRGEGKRTELTRFEERAGEEGLPIRRGRMRRARFTEAEVLGWLAEVAGLTCAPRPDALIAGLHELPPTVFVVEQMHRAFMRTVGGFEGMSTLLYVLNATSHHHFWMVTMHRPAWRYLASVPSLVDVGVFRAVVSLEPFDASMLRDLAQRRAAAAGLSLDHGTLMRANLLGADPQVEQERATSSFYRLLAEASEGNPRVAMHLFAACLEPAPDGVARVHTRRALATDVAAELGVDALFTLVALRQQDTMTLEELVRVTNLPEAAVRNTTRDLQSRGLIASAANLLYIPIDHLPLVSRTLRRRHLLYLGH